MVDVLDWLATRNRTVQDAYAAGDRVPYDPLDARTYRSPVPVGANTERQLVGVLKMALRAAVKRRLLVFNPVDEVELPEVERYDARVWSPEEVVTFVNGTEDHRLGALFRLVLLRGLRRGEVCGLKWSDVDLDARRITIRRSMAYAGANGVLTSRPKTKTSARVVSLDGGTVEALRVHRRRQLAERLVAGETWHDGDWVFARTDGTPEPPYAVTREFARLTANLDLPVIRLHDGRHTAATLGLEAGLDVKLVSDQLGHASTRITHDLYSHVRRAKHDEAAEAVSDLVFGRRAERSPNERR